MSSRERARVYQAPITTLFRVRCELLSLLTKAYENSPRMTNDRSIRSRSTTTLRPASGLKLCDAVIRLKRCRDIGTYRRTVSWLRTDVARGGSAMNRTRAGGHPATRARSRSGCPPASFLVVDRRSRQRKVRTEWISNRQNLCKRRIYGACDE